MNSITELAEQQNTIKEDGIEIRLQKLDVPNTPDYHQWMIKGLLDGQKIYFSGQDSFDDAKIDQFRLANLLRKHGDEMREFAEAFGWNNVLHSLMMHNWGDELSLMFPFGGSWCEPK